MATPRHAISETLHFDSRSNPRKNFIQPAPSILLYPNRSWVVMLLSVVLKFRVLFVYRPRIGKDEVGCNRRDMQREDDKCFWKQLLKKLTSGYVKNSKKLFVSMH